MRNIEDKMIVMLLGIVFSIILLFPQRVHAEVNITNERGENILLKDGAALRTAEPVIFNVYEDGLTYYSFSVDGGITFTDFVPMNDKQITLYPDYGLCPTGIYKIRFKNENAISREYTVQFDFEPPAISLVNEELLNRWLDKEEVLKVQIDDDIEIKQIWATVNGQTIAERFFDENDEANNIFEIPLNEYSYSNDGQQVMVHALDEAQNEAVLSCNYYLDGGSCGGSENDAGKSDKIVNYSIPPEIMIAGVDGSSDIKGPVQVMVGISSPFYEVCDIDISVIRNRNGEEKVLPIEKQKMHSPNEVRILSLVNDGDYTVSVSATNENGMSAFKSTVFRIDSNAPLIKITGIDEGIATNRVPTIKVNAKECFYDTTSIVSSLYKKDNKGSMQLVETYKYDMKQNQDFQSIEVKEEGEYKLVATALDRSGNSSSESMNFKVDYTPPQISDLENINEKYIKSLDISGKTLVSLISDMTSYTYEAFLNDERIDKDSKVTEEGKYVLYLSATDEADNVSEKMATFIIDNTAPQITIRGVNEDGYIRKGSEITVGLSEESDELLEVIFNGKQIPIDVNKMTASFKVEDIGDNNIEVRAIDKAKNETNKIIHTNCIAFAMPQNDFVKSGKTLTPIIGDSDKNDIDFKGVIIGVITMLSGTFGLVFRALRAD